MPVRLLTSVLALVGLVSCLLTPMQAYAVDDDPVAIIRAALAEDGLYVHPAVVNGDGRLWERRLSEALAQVSLEAPAVVALWPETTGSPQLDEPRDPEEYAAALGVDRGALHFSVYGAERVLIGYVPDADQAVWDAAEERARAVVNDVLRRQAGEILPAAEIWITLLLVGDDPPQARALADRLQNDPSVIVSQPGAAPGDSGSFDTDDVGTTTWVTIGFFIAASLLLLAGAAVSALRASRDPARKQGRDRQVLVEPWVTELTPLILEQELTQLAEQIAAAPARPGDRQYDRAQACAEAAGRYVDSDVARDRVGVHLLVADGLAALQALDPPARCFFNPRHAGESSVKRSAGGTGGVTVPSCRRCAAAVGSGAEPPAMMLRELDGRVGPYFAVEDVWSRTGYGALDPAWADVVLRNSLAVRDGGAR